MAIFDKILFGSYLTQVNRYASNERAGYVVVQEPKEAAHFEEARVSLQSPLSDRVEVLQPDETYRVDRHFVIRKADSQDLEACRSFWTRMDRISKFALGFAVVSAMGSILVALFFFSRRNIIIGGACAFGSVIMGGRFLGYFIKTHAEVEKFDEYIKVAQGNVGEAFAQKRTEFCPANVTEMMLRKNSLIRPAEKRYLYLKEFKNLWDLLTKNQYSSEEVNQWCEKLFKSSALFQKEAIEEVFGVNSPLVPMAVDFKRICDFLRTSEAACRTYQQQINGAIQLVQERQQAWLQTLDQIYRKQPQTEWSMLVYSFIARLSEKHFEESVVPKLENLRFESLPVYHLLRKFFTRAYHATFFNSQYQPLQFDINTLTPPLPTAQQIDRWIRNEFHHRFVGIRVRPEIQQEFFLFFYQMRAHFQ